MARIHVSGGGLFDTKYTTVYLYLVRFDSESVRRLKKKNPSILADVRVKTVEVYANRSEKNIKRGGCCFVALCTHEHIHNKSAEPSEILFMSERKRAEKNQKKLEFHVFHTSRFFCLRFILKPTGSHTISGERKKQSENHCSRKLEKLHRIEIEERMNRIK